VTGLLEEGDEGVPVLGLVVGAVDEDEVGFGHCCGVFLNLCLVRVILWLL
jgi:hypothetical protein